VTQRVGEFECLCGAREIADDQPVPRTCWNCKAETMGAFGNRATRIDVTATPPPPPARDIPVHSQHPARARPAPKNQPLNADQLEFL
jgi:hypothetical protein